MTRGFNRVRPLEGGFDAWVNAGHEVERDGEMLVTLGPVRQ
jgi:3-mercaptopyruvate sulfurtransferase SseA